MCRHGTVNPCIHGQTCSNVMCVSIHRLQFFMSKNLAHTSVLSTVQRNNRDLITSLLNASLVCYPSLIVDAHEFRMLCLRPSVPMLTLRGVNCSVHVGCHLNKLHCFSFSLIMHAPATECSTARSDAMATTSDRRMASTQSK